MALPDSVDLRHLNGSFNLNKSLSDDPDAILKMQGISWVVRQAIKLSNVRINVKEYTDSDGIVHIDIEQISSVSTNKEERSLDNIEREKEDAIFGKVRGRNQWINVNELDDDFLRNGWDPKWLDEVAHGEVLQNAVESVGKDPNWAAQQIWGFAVVNGERRYVRQIVSRRGNEVHKIRSVYDWIN